MIFSVFHRHLKGSKANYQIGIGTERRKSNTFFDPHHQKEEQIAIFVNK